jgi:hypothetical protein
MATYDYKGQQFELPDGLTKDQAIGKIESFLHLQSLKNQASIEMTGKPLSYDPGKSLEEAPRQVSKVESFVAGAAPPATMGLIYPVTAAVKTLSEPKSVMDTRSFPQRFMDNLQVVREKSDIARKANPGTATAGNVAGFVSPGSWARKTFTGIMSRVAPEGAGLMRNVLGSVLGSVATGQAESVRPITDIKGRAEDAAWQAGLGSAGGAVGYGAGKAYQKVFDPSKAIVPEAAAAQQQAMKSAGVMVPLSPAELTTSRSTDFVESLLERSPFSAGNFQRFGTAQKSALEAGAQRLESKAGLGVGEIVDDGYVGKTVLDAVKSAKDAFKKQAAALYDRVDDLAKGTLFSPNATRKALVRINYEGSRGIDFSTSPVSRYIGKMQSVYGLESKPVETFQGLKEKLSEVSGYIRQADKVGDRQAVRYFSTLKDAMTSDLESAGAQLESQGLKDAAAALKQANTFYRDGMKVLDSEITKNIGKLGKTGKTEMVFGEAIRKGRSQEVQKLRGFIGEEAFQPVRQRFLQNIIRNPKDGQIDVLGDSLQNRLHSMGKQTVRAVLGNDDADALYALAEVAKFAKTAKTVSTTPARWNLSTISAASAVPAAGAALAALGQPSAAAGMVAGVGANIALAKIWYSPLGRKLLVDGFQTMKGRLDPQRAIFLIDSVLRQIPTGGE